MLRSNDKAGSFSATAFGAWRTPADPIIILEDESEWRVLPQGPRITSLGPPVMSSRWRAFQQRSQEFSAVTPADRYVVKIVLRSMNIRLSVAGRIVHDGVALPGMFHITAPSAAVRCLFRGPYDVLHLHVPSDLVAECASDMPVHQNTLCSNAKLSSDSTVERLARALLESNRIDASFGTLYANGVGTAVVARLMALTRQAVPNEQPHVTALARWRLKRAIDFVEARLAEPISLADIASVAGLSRMHFAAQFRVATGMRPHEYLLRRRIERAQEMLVGTRMSLVDVALSVGFQSHSHFTGVFKRFVGRPPRDWRASHGNP